MILFALLVGQWDFIVNGRRRSYNLSSTSHSDAIRWVTAIQEVSTSFNGAHHSKGFCCLYKIRGCRLSVLVLYNALLSIALHYFALLCTTLHYFVLHCITLHYFALKVGQQFCV